MEIFKFVDAPLLIRDLFLLAFHIPYKEKKQGTIIIDSLELKGSKDTFLFKKTNISGVFLLIKFNHEFLRPKFF